MIEKSCDYCEEGLSLKDGWHYRIDPEDIEGTAKVRCMNVESNDAPVDKSNNSTE